MQKTQPSLKIIKRLNKGYGNNGMKLIWLCFRSMWRVSLPWIQMLLLMRRYPVLRVLPPILPKPANFRRSVSDHMLLVIYCYCTACSNSHDLKEMLIYSPNVDDFFPLWGYKYVLFYAYNYADLLISVFYFQTKRVTAIPKPENAPRENRGVFQWRAFQFESLRLRADSGFEVYPCDFSAAAVGTTRPRPSQHSQHLDPPAPSIPPPTAFNQTLIQQQNGNTSANLMMHFCGSLATF